MHCHLLHTPAGWGAPLRCQTSPSNPAPPTAVEAPACPLVCARTDLGHAFRIHLWDSAEDDRMKRGREGQEVGRPQRLAAQLLEPEISHARSHARDAQLPTCDAGAGERVSGGHAFWGPSIASIGAIPESPVGAPIALSISLPRDFCVLFLTTGFPFLCKRQNHYAMPPRRSLRTCQLPSVTRGPTFCAQSFGWPVLWSPRVSCMARVVWLVSVAWCMWCLGSRWSVRRDSRIECPAAAVGGAPPAPRSLD